MTTAPAARTTPADLASELGVSGVICSQCGASMADYAERCSAAIDEPCPGFLAIEGAFQHLRLTGARK